jgi:hypothetical protein
MVSPYGLPEPAALPDLNHRNARSCGKGREEALICPRCKIAMVQIVHVESFGDQPALEVYECRNCGHFVSQLRE